MCSAFVEGVFWSSMTIDEGFPTTDGDCTSRKPPELRGKENGKRVPAAR